MINNVTLQGRLTANADLRRTTAGKSVTSFCIAVERDYAQNGERQADFINLVAWEHTAEFITKYFSKGDMIVITGSIRTRKYEDSNGNNRTATEVLIDKANFCGSKTEKKEDPKPNDADPFDLSGFEEILSGDEAPF